MTSVQQRQKLLGLVIQACADGARLRWQRQKAAQGDQRPSGKRRYARPTHKLSEKERQAVMATLNSEAFKDLPPSQIVPRLGRQRRLRGDGVHDVPPVAPRLAS